MAEKSSHLIAVYEQYWSNARENESHRLWFTNIYVLITAGVLALMWKGYGNSLSLAFYIFLLILSIIGLFVSYTNGLAFVWYSRMCEKILYDLNLGKEYSHWYGDHRIFEITEKRVSMVRLYIYFYTLMIGVMTSLILWKLMQALSYDSVWGLLISIIGACSSLSFFIAIYFKLLRRDINKIHEHFREIISKSP